MLKSFFMLKSRKMLLAVHKMVNFGKISLKKLYTLFSRWDFFCLFWLTYMFEKAKGLKIFKNTLNFFFVPWDLY